MSSMVVDRGRQLEAKFIGSGRCLPVARGRAGAQGVKGTCGPGIQRALGAAHSIPTSPLLPSLPPAAVPPHAPLIYLPTPRLRVPLLLSHCCSPRRPASRRLALTPRPPAGVFELAFFPRAAFAFREFRRARCDEPHDFAESSFPGGKNPRRFSRFSQISGYYSLSCKPRIDTL